MAYIEHEEAVALSQLAANSSSTACQAPGAAANHHYRLPSSEPRKRTSCLIVEETEVAGCCALI